MIRSALLVCRRFEQFFEMPGEGDMPAPIDRPIRVTPAWARWGVTAFFVICLVLQAGTFGHKALTWPFMRYPMFNTAYKAPVVHHAYVVYARLADGREVFITPEAVGLHFWQFNARVASPMFYEQLPSLMPLRDTVRQRLHLDATAFRVERRTWKLGDDGVTVNTRDKTFDVETYVKASSADRARGVETSDGQ